LRIKNVTDSRGNSNKNANQSGLFLLMVMMIFVSAYTPQTIETLPPTITV